MSALEWEIYKDWFAWLVENNYAPRPSGFIYLRVEPTKAYERIQKRSRSEESAIPLAYLSSLHNKHEDWLVHRTEAFASLRDVPILTIDCNQEFETDFERQQQHLETIHDFIEKLSVVVPATRPATTASFSL